MRSCQRELYVTLGHLRLTDEVLQTSLFIVEQLNARPLTTVSSDATELEALIFNLFCWLVTIVPSSLFFLSYKSPKAVRLSADAIWTRMLRECIRGILRTKVQFESLNHKARDGRVVKLKYGIVGFTCTTNIKTESDPTCTVV